MTVSLDNDLIDSVKCKNRIGPQQPLINRNAHKRFLIHDRSVEILPCEQAHCQENINDFIFLAVQDASGGALQFFKE
jgi:hypothetical protein